MWLDVPTVGSLREILLDKFIGVFVGGYGAYSTC